MKRFHAANALVFQYAYVRPGSNLEDPQISTAIALMAARPGFTADDIMAEIQKFSDESERRKLMPEKDPPVKFDPWLQTVGFDDENIMVRLKYNDFVKIANSVYGPGGHWFKKNRQYLIPREQQRMFAEELVRSGKKFRMEGDMLPEPGKVMEVLLESIDGKN